MFHKPLLSRFALSPLVAAFLGVAAISRPSPVQAQDMADIARELNALRSQISKLEARVVEAERRADAAEENAGATGKLAAQWPIAPSTAPGPDGKPVVSEPPHVSPQEGWWTKTTIGGYGELHLNLGDKQQIDFHRFVIFFGHDFNERIRLFAELEVEHALAGDGEPGEVELEQAYIEFDVMKWLSMKAGVFLIPTGIINEVHEPTTFFGVERNLVETEIIPSTWWEGGLALSARLESGFTFDLAFHSGLNTNADFDIRSGREKVAEAPAQDGAVTGRILYRGLPGLEVGVSGQYQSDLTQVTAGENNPAYLTEAHVDWQSGGFGLRALYARWDIMGPNVPEEAREQYGLYVEPSYTFRTTAGDLGFFGRYSRIDAVGMGGEVDVWTLGLSYWPHENVVFKGDYRDISGDVEEQTYNFGVGYVF